MFMPLWVLVLATFAIAYLLREYYDLLVHYQLVRHCYIEMSDWSIGRLKQIEEEPGDLHG